MLHTLTQINLDDLVSAFGAESYPFVSKVLRLLFRRPAANFARHMIEYDTAVETGYLAAGGRVLLNRYTRGLRVLHPERIPRGAFLALSNHPGMTDTVALFAALNRPDLKVIALDRPFLNALPHTSKHLFYVHDDPAKRMSLVRQVSAHLKNGGAALTFPAGHIEPDPDVHAGAVESLKSWTDSVGVFIRMAPQTAIVPVLVRGVVWEKAEKNWIVKTRKTKDKREKLAAAVQLLGMIVFKLKPVSVTVEIGNPIYLNELESAEPGLIHQAVLMEMKRLITVTSKH